MIGTSAKPLIQRVVLAALLLALAVILLLRRSPQALSVPSAAVEPGADAAAADGRFPFKPYEGTVAIERDMRAVSPGGDGPTALDGMDRGQLAEFRLGQVRKYSQLGFYHPGYQPFSPPHDRIYASITPGGDWLYSVPYFLANPYLLIILVDANHVSPIDLYVDEADIRYQDGCLVETIRGASARQWFARVFDATDYPGIVRLVMVNAWDAGFRFIHLDPSRSRNVRTSERPNNVTRSWHSQHGFFHVGKYGKNNLSPEDRRGWVELQERDAPTRLHVKLWRLQPAGVQDRPDLVWVFIIDPEAQ